MQALPADLDAHGSRHLPDWLTAEHLRFGLRLWASVSLALFLAYWLQLDNPFWAGTSAGIVAQPSLGASLRKANFRLIGTVLGAVMIVLLMAAFPQSRVGFILALAVWCSLCGFAATVLQNFASYAAALAGYTAVIIAADAISDPTGVFLLAVARGSEICLGIVCAGLVLVLTGRGTARERAATTIADIARETGLGLRHTIEGAGAPPTDSSPARRALIGRATALSALLDETVGESPDLRVRSHALQAAVDGLFTALSGWRMVATHLETVPPAQARADAAAIVAALPPGPAIVMTARSSPADTRDRCRDAAHTLAALSVATPAEELVVYATVESLHGLDRALNGVALLVEPARAEDTPGVEALRLPDLLPALLNGIRSFLIILAVAGGWIATAWPAGPQALVFAAIIVLLLSPRGDAAVSGAWEFLGGTLATSTLAGIVNFAVLPNHEGFLSLALILGIVLVPLAAISAGDWHKAFFVAAATNFTPLLAPANLPTYDTISFYNSTLAIVVGVGTGALALALLPQLSKRRRAERLRLLTLRDLKRLAVQPRLESVRRWEALSYGRLAALPEGTDPLAHAEMIAALYAGGAILRLRRWAARFTREDRLDPLFKALGAGQVPQAMLALRRADAAFAIAEGPPAELRRARAALLALQEALTRHAGYFGVTQPEREGRDALH